VEVRVLLLEGEPVRVMPDNYATQALEVKVWMEEPGFKDPLVAEFTSCSS
jgi:hypothetical protein